MCGITGIRSYAAPPEPALVQAMTAALHHRGPDGSGCYLDDQVALGHTRLAIVDTVGGVQPMTGEDGTVWVSFNGEIFNHVELRALLRDRGHTFATRSDTEVVVHAWEEWGPGCFERFNGQWALAVRDRRTDTLVLSRDRFGVRPLYYARTPHRLVFGSEVKALFVDPAVPRELDPVGLDQTLTFWSAVAPRTVFAGVRQVPPGSYLVVDGRGESLHTYWTPRFPERGAEPLRDLAANAVALRERLVEATRLRFERADVPVGAYLSGGIDSSVTASVIAGSTGAELHTFSLRFGGASREEYDEGDFQGVMARRLGTAHHDVVVTEGDIAAVFPDVVRHAETPLLRTAPAPMFLLSRLVRDSGFKVVVTGEGADEVLAGYDLFREAKVRHLWARDPSSPLLEGALERLYPWMRRSPNQAPAFARSFFARNLDPADPALSHRPRWDSTSALKAMLTPDVHHDGADAADTLVAAMPLEAGGWDPLARAQWLEMTTLLPGYILSSQGDRMLMGNSVEGRFPFLDVHVAALAAQVPAEHLVAGLDEKHLLKQAFADLLPTEILERPKQPYRAPAALVGGPDEPAWVDEVTSPDAVAEAGVFSPALVERLLAKCRRAPHTLGNTDAMRLVAVLSTQLLHRDLLTGERAAEARPRSPMAVLDATGSRL